MVNQRKIENFILSALVGIAGFIASYIRDLSQSLDRMNSQMIVVVERMSTTDYMLKDHESRLRRVEQ